MSREIQAKVLCGFLADRYLLSRAVSDGFSADIFSDANYRMIFKTVNDMIQMPGQIVDWITIETNLRNREWFTPEMGQALAEIKNEIAPQADQLMAYVEILKDENVREKMLRLAKVMSTYCMHKGQYKDEDFLEFSSKIIQSLIEMQKQKVKRRMSPLRETIREIQEMTNRKKWGEKQLLGFSIQPFTRLETLLSGIRKGFYYGLAGPPRRGKTTFALDVASRLAERNSFPVLFYTWEQTRKTLAARLLGRECYINPVKLLTDVSPEERERHALVTKVI